MWVNIKFTQIYQVYTDFVSVLLLIVNLVFRFKFAAILFSV